MCYSPHTTISHARVMTSNTEGMCIRILDAYDNDSPRQVRATIVTKGEFQDLLEQTLCNESSSRFIPVGDGRSVTRLVLKPTEKMFCMEH